MKLLVTGANGLLGHKICEYAVKNQFQVYSSYRRNTPLIGIPVEIDITNKKIVQKTLEKIKPDILIHGAALTDVDKCEREPNLAWKINVEGVKNIVKWCKKLQVYLVYISTDYVFDGKKGMYTERDSPNPINYYGISKLAGEEQVKQVSDNYCIVRTSVIYGANKARGKVNFALWILEKLRQKENIKIVTDQWNSPTLNTSLTQMILELVKKRINGIYHLAGSTRIDRFNFSKLLAKIFDMDSSLISPVLSKDFSWSANRPRDSSLEVGKATRTLTATPLEIEKALYTLKNELGNNIAF